MKRYDEFVRDALAEIGMSSTSEGEDDETRVAGNPVVVMADEKKQGTATCG